MKKNKSLMAGLLAVGLCLGLSWGVSPLMAASIFQPNDSTLRGFKTQKRYIQPTTQKNINSQKLGSASEKAKKARESKTSALTGRASKVTTKNPLILSPGYGKNVVSAVDNTSKFKHTDAGKPVNINIGQPVTLNPKGIQQNVPKAIQAERAAAAKKAQQDAWNKSGGYGGNGGNGVLPPGPARVPGSAPPPSGQSNQNQRETICAQLNLPILCH